MATAKGVKSIRLVAYIMTSRLGVVVALFGRVARRITSPLRADPDTTGLRISTAETHTTTQDGGIGWAERPPALLCCQECGETIQQEHARDDIDCSHCLAEFSHQSFPELELESLLCPTCGDHMDHGQRHPDRFDIPEWATCHRCRYHWEYKHSY